MAEIKTAITDQPLDVAQAVAEVSSKECGGIGLFVGMVRESPAAPDAAGAVTALEYEAHPELAEEALRAVAEGAAARWDVRRIVSAHRSGRCATGEPTVVVACSAPHRADALEACRWMIDEIKQQVPIWKREVYADGSSWVRGGP